MASSALAIARAAYADPAPPPSNVKEVVVTAPRQEAAARDRQFHAPNLVNIQPAETILKYPDFNAAEALGRIPGVSISTDTGEGRFVNIRGIDGNLAGATFGGVPLLNTNPGGTYFGGGGRAVEYDTIPTGSIDGIIVYKTTLPDHEAEGLGGSIDLTPRTAAGVDRPFIEATAGYGYEPMHGHAGPLNLEGAVGARFGFDGGRLVLPGDPNKPALSGWVTNPTPFSFVLTASRREDRRGFDDIEEDYNDTTVDRSYADLQFRRYDYHRRRFGYGGEFEFNPNDDHHWYLRANVAGYTESVKKNRLTYSPNSDTTVDPANPTGFAGTAAVDLASTDEEETHRNQVYVIGGVDRFGGGEVLDYRASYSRATFDVTRNYSADFNGPQDIPFSYDNSANNGNFPHINVDTSIINDPNQYEPITSVGNSTEFDVDREYAYAANLSIPAPLFSDTDHVKIGAQARLREKTSSPHSFDDNLTTPLQLVNASDPAITDFYSGHYTNGPNINIFDVRAAAQEAARTGNEVEDPGQNDLAGAFSAKEDIYSGYAEYEGDVGKLGILAGVRVEATRALYGAYTDDNVDEQFEFTSRREDYTNAFPTVQLRYQLRPDFLIRATYSTGIGRPGFLQNTAAVVSSHDPNNPVIVQGNPNLKPTTGDNFDLSFELYLPKGGILQFGLFDKEFQDYIVTLSRKLPYTGSDPVFQNLPIPVEYDTFANRSGAYARGLEAAYHQQFLWLPGFWSGFGLEANVTLVDSHIEEYDALTSPTGHAEFGMLPGTSRLTWNIAPFYEAHGLQIRVAGEYVSKELFKLGGTKILDTIQDDRLSVDFTSSYEFHPNWQIYFNVKNLTNAPLRFYVDNPSLPIQREYYLQTYEFGLRARF
jgi:TonB-dependent receptor